MFLLHTPQDQGSLRSRTIKSLLQEAEKLVGQGVVELNLIAQNLPDYGRDLQGGANLVNLLGELIQIEKLKWIRLLYLYPEELSDELLSLIASETKVCKYLDIPIQHINNSILRSMRRKTQGELIRERIKEIRNRIPPCGSARRSWWAIPVRQKIIFKNSSLSSRKVGSIILGSSPSLERKKLTPMLYSIK